MCNFFSAAADLWGKKAGGEPADGESVEGISRIGTRQADAQVDRLAWRQGRQMELALAGQLCYNRPVWVSVVIDHIKEDEGAASDGAYITRILNGDRNAFAFLLKKYKMYVLKIVSRHVPYEDAEEVAHDAFIRVYESLAKFTGTGGFRHWLAAIATRTCYDYWRRTYRSKEVAMSSLGDEHREWLEQVAAEPAGGSLDDIGRQVEAREVLDWALARLSPEDRMVLELVYMEGLSVREVADILGWSVANVKIRSFRSRRKLHKLLKDAGRK
jgi:RNA polymerase sigma-70 factor (ECF subfamily)